MKELEVFLKTVVDGMKGMAQGIEKRHAAKEEQKGFQRVQSQIDPPQPDHGVLVARLELFLGDHLAGTGFRTKEAQPAHAVRQEDHGQRQKPHSPQQMGLAPPKQQTVRHGLDIRQNRRPARRIARHHFEKAVGKGWNRAVDQKWQGRKSGDQHPPEGGDGKSISDAQIFTSSKSTPERQAQGDRDDRRNQERKQVVLLVVEGTDHRENHGGPGYDQQGSQNVGDRRKMHRIP